MSATLDKTHTPEQIDVCLMLVAIQGGRVRRAMPLIREHGIEVAESTLNRWKNELYEQEYHELQEKHASAIARRAAARAMEVAEHAAEGVERFVEKALGGLEQIDPSTAAEVRDLATSARNLSQVQVNSVEKARLLRDQPTEIQSLESLDELVEVLRAAGVVRAVDAEHVEEESPALPPPA